MAAHPRKIGSVKVIDMDTGKVVSEKQNAFTLLPCAPDVCQECGVDHPHDMPHDRDSLTYQMRFLGTHGRGPTWTDAMAHCTPEMQRITRQALRDTLRKHNLPIPPDLVEVPGEEAESPRHNGRPDQGGLSGRWPD